MPFPSRSIVIIVSPSKYQSPDNDNMRHNPTTKRRGSPYKGLETFVWCVWIYFPCLSCDSGGGNQYSDKRAEEEFGKIHIYGWVRYAKVKYKYALYKLWRVKSPSFIRRSNASTHQSYDMHLCLSFILTLRVYMDWLQCFWIISRCR